MAVEEVQAWRAGDGTLHTDAALAKRADLLHAIRVVAKTLARELTAPHENEAETLRCILNNVDLVLELAGALHAAQAAGVSLATADV